MRGPGLRVLVWACPVRGGTSERKLSLEPKPTEVTRIHARRPRLTFVVLVLSVLIILFFAFVPPHTVLGKADVVGYAICHRITERSFVLGDRHFPLCARCTGTFLGALVGLATMLLLGRRRAGRLPPAPVLVLLVLFVGAWGFDGFNSYMTFFPGGPNLYEPQNWLRMTTGLLNGLALSILVFPIFNFTLWREATRERVIKNVWELLAILPVIALLVLAVQSDVGILLYPLAVLSSAGVVVMLIMINSMIASVVLGREGYAQSWSEALVPLTAGLALAILMMTAMVALRAYLTFTLGLPF
jgi:uncharacterized membrane protein